MSFYTRHSKTIKKLMSIFICSHSLRHRINTVFSYPGGANEYFKQCNALKQRNTTKKSTPKDLCCVVAIIKDEGPYLAEWLEYYKQIGVDRFYIYDNDSTDNTTDILQPYIQSGIVKYTYFPGSKMQMPAYAHFLKNFAHDAQWAIVVDLDEFIVCRHKPLREYLSNQPRRVSQIVVPCAIFGSNGHITKPDGLVLENYTRRSKKQQLYKSIARPERVLELRVHDHTVCGKTIFPKMTKIAVNHYYCKSWAEFSRRANRGDAFFGSDYARQTFTKERFDKYDLNEILDTYILQYVPKIKQALQSTENK